MSSMFPHTPRSLKAYREELERIELFKGRPDRQTIISEDEIINLSITLGTSQDVSDFIRSI